MQEPKKNFNFGMHPISVITYFLKLKKKPQVQQWFNKGVKFSFTENFDLKVCVIRGRLKTG